MTQVSATVDFAAPGKQVGWLRVPHSVTRSAYGVIPVPIAVWRNGDGPAILLTAGTAMLSAAPITLDPIFSGLGWSLICGLVASTLFTLFVIPISYRLLRGDMNG